MLLRGRNTNIEGKPFGSATVGQVWGKGRIIKDFDPNVWRYDVCGNPIKFSEYGNINSKHGWEVDHIKPVSKGGGDEITNLQPLQWENNRRKSDTYPWSCS